MVYDEVLLAEGNELYAVLDKVLFVETAGTRSNGYKVNKCTFRKKINRNWFVDKSDDCNKVSIYGYS